MKQTKFNGRRFILKEDKIILWYHNGIITEREFIRIYPNTSPIPNLIRHEKEIEPFEKIPTEEQERINKLIILLSLKENNK